MVTSTKGNTGKRRFFLTFGGVIAFLIWSLFVLLVGQWTAVSAPSSTNNEEDKEKGITTLNYKKTKLLNPGDESQYHASNWVWDLIETPCERLGASQGNQDCILDTIFDNIGISPHRYFVEYGFNTPTQCSGSGPNTCRLYRDWEWKGLLLDAEHENHDIGLYQHALYSNNIVSILDEYKVPIDLDFLSSDMDSHDYFVLKAILESGKYRPRVISVEYNSNWPLGWSIAMVDPLLNHPEIKNPLFKKANCAWGASASSWEDLMRRQGYSLVAVTHMLDLFYVRDDLLENVVVPSSAEYFDTNVEEPSFGSHLHHTAIPTNAVLNDVLDVLIDTRIYEATKNLKLAKKIAANKIRTMIALGDPFTLQCFANVVLPTGDEGGS